MNEFLLGIPGKLTNVLSSLSTLLSRVTGNVDVNVSSRAPASTAMSNAVWTDALATKLGNGGLNASPSAALTWSGGGFSYGISGYSITNPGRNTVKASTTSTSMVDVVNITGSGYITALFMFTNGTDGGAVELVIDGVVVSSKTAGAGGAMMMLVGWIAENYYWSGTEVRTIIQCMESQPVYFNTSLVIRHRKTSSVSGTAQDVYYRYVKT